MPTANAGRIMSYQVLARKWRPRTFAELVGQTHVVQPLTHALNHGQLHHALLFSGTRGVGKTTLARLFAKALNCETGVSAEPCGQCSACQAIEQGRFVDLIEIDAASRTKVEDTRDLLDNVQYAPTQGRYKVYLIDEVHMLSRHSFNALLKTLEEPPPHIKFILATTDPQRLPATILSRCLQFNLKRVPERLIAERLSYILTQEQIAYEAAAVHWLARAGDGSLRDALTLLDQAIAFTGGHVVAAAVHDMLGTIDPHHAAQLLQHIATHDAAALLQQIAVLDERAPDYSQLLGDLLVWLQRIAVAQLVPTAARVDDTDAELLHDLAQAMTPEDTQLYYQIALLGRRDLPLAVDARSGFEMLLLRMLSFAPVAQASTSPAAPPAAVPPVPPRPVPPVQRSTPQPAAAPPAAPSAPGAEVAGLDPLTNWESLVTSLALSGLGMQLARQCSVVDWQHQTLTLSIARRHETLATKRLIESLRSALCQRLGVEIELKMRWAEEGQAPQNTLAQQEAAQQAERQRDAERLLEQDPNVRALQETFNAQLRPDSVRPWSDASPQPSVPDRPNSERKQ